MNLSRLLKEYFKARVILRQDQRKAVKAASGWHRRILSPALFIFCLAGPLAAQAQWKRYEEPEGNFSVLFPGQPKKDTVGPIQEGIESSNGFSASDGSVHVGVFYVHIKQERKVDEANFDAYKKYFFSGFPKCVELNTTAASPVFPSYIGHAYRLECQGQNAQGQTGREIVVVNLYFGKHFSYVLTAGSTITPEPRIIHEFLDSFSVTDVSK